MDASTKNYREKSFEFVPLEDADAQESHSGAPQRIKGNNASDNQTPDPTSQTYTVEDAVEASGFGRFQLLLFVICGILMATDAMEMLLLSILGPALRCQWHLSSQQIAAITTVVFVGYLIGSPIWGFVSDKFGRWPIVFTVLAMISYYGFLTTISPTFVWILILRFLVGFAIGGGSNSFTLLSEFVPKKYRAKFLLCFQVFWAIGSTMEVGLAYLILPRYGWRWLVFASAIPLALFLVLLKWLPESPRYLVTAGFISEAEKVIKKMWKMNRITPIEGRLVSSSTAAHRLGSIKELFSRRYLCTTLMLPTIWFGAAFGYYGVVLLSAEIFRFRHFCFGDWEQSPDFHGNWSHGTTAQLDASCCKELSNDDFLAMIISSVGEFVNIPLLVLVIDCFGRKITMGLWNGLTGFMFFLLYVCMSKEAMTGVLFMVYPTSVRAMAVGSFSSIARLGAILTPYVAQVMLPEVSQIGALSLYAVVGILCSVLSFLLPIETAGSDLPQSSGDDQQHLPLSTTFIELSYMPFTGDGLSS
ncbi:synaptic vesicle 2 protein isoform X1 [Paragonimus heterotremus]|uniref:Synaptic vesicle 2 protein isoform X1 n=1 Tax=Paragonimus heterotremus TaxID=100268 RepID=A0A8J4SKT5_9TREM|nr:synaptic vesicle 2 protein isoform X1 [Paragonimus heterotremus]